MTDIPSPTALQPSRRLRIATVVTLPVRAISHSRPRTRITVAVGMLVLGLGWMLGPGASWLLRDVDGVHGLTGKDLAVALDAVRGRALTIATGLLALAAVYYTARNAETARRTFQLGEQGQVTERYTKAIEQLGAESLDIRLGGIYGLERIAADSARDHPTVMEVLTAFIREHAPATTLGSITDVGTTTSQASALQAATRSAPRVDIQAALTVVGRRTARKDTRSLDLSLANLASANLRGLNLANVNLVSTILAGAIMSRANLVGAIMSRANLVGANLRDADLRDADLSGADLAAASLLHSNLVGADLRDVNLRYAVLTGAELTGVSWNEQIVWPDAAVERIRVASQEIAPGIFRIDGPFRA
jgi:hypothetical protein